MDKCIFCPDKVTRGREPACVEACPTGALQFGDRHKLIAKGKERVEDIKGTYPEANFYGEKEFGGNCSLPRREEGMANCKTV